MTPPPLRYVVLGAGIEGQSAASFLFRRGAHVLVADQAERSVPDGVASLFGPRYLDALASADVVVRSPGVRRDLPELIAAEARGALVTSSTKLFLEGSHTLDLPPAPAQVVAVTGSNGKTTCTSLLFALAQRIAARQTPPRRVWLGGNIGTSVLDFRDDVHPEDLVILELSSFQLEDVTVSPWMGVVLNVTPNHLDQHPSFDAYIAAKRRCIDQPGNVWAVLNDIDPITKGWVASHPGSVRVFSGAITGEDGSIRCEMLDADNHLLRVELPADALHFRTHPSTIHAALTAAALLGATEEDARAVLTEFRGVEHRLQLVRTYAGVSYYDDSANTTPESAIVALRAFPAGRAVILLGGSDKGTPFDALASEVIARKARPVLMGQVAPRIAAAIRAIDPAYPIAFEPAFQQDFPAVLDAARALAREGDVVLLSTGCASFGMFQNYKHRAEEFVRIVTSW